MRCSCSVCFSHVTLVAIQDTDSTSSQLPLRVRRPNIIAAFFSAFARNPTGLHVAASLFLRLNMVCSRPVASPALCCHVSGAALAICMVWAKSCGARTPRQRVKGGRAPRVFLSAVLGRPAEPWGSRGAWGRGELTGHRPRARPWDLAADNRASPPRRFRSPAWRAPDPPPTRCSLLSSRISLPAASPARSPRPAPLPSSA